jgi:hypothetical protein
MTENGQAMRRISPLSHVQATLERWYTLFGEPLRFQTNDARLLEAADEAFGRFPACLPGAPDPLDIRLFVEEPHYPEQDGIPFKPVHRTMGHLLYFQFGANNTAVLDLRQGFAFGFVSPSVAQDRVFVRLNFIETMSQAAASLSRNFSHIHAACVIKDGISVLLQAHNGTGKSTLTYACARRGYQVLTEDMVQVKVRPGGVELWGLPWRLHLLPDAKRFFPELAGLEPIQFNNDSKLEVDLEALLPGSPVIHAAPGLAVLVVRGTPGPTRLEPISFMQALQASEIIWTWEIGWTPELERGSQELLKGGTYRLHMNGTPDEAVDALDALVIEQKGIKR